MSKKEMPDRCNLTYLAGEIKSLKIREDSAFLLLDCGPENKYVPCTIFRAAKLLDIVRRFHEGDRLKVVGFVRPWSQKNGNAWENHVDVRLTEIRTPPPARQREPGDDDDTPF